MSLPLGDAARLLRALGLPLAPAIDAETSHNVGRPTPLARLQLPAASEDFELPPYPSSLSTPRRRRQPSIDLRLVNLPGSTTIAKPLFCDATQDLRFGRSRLGSTGSGDNSRPASPAPSWCSSTKSDSDSSDASSSRPHHLGRRKQSARRTTTPEAEALWRQYWD